MNIRHCVVYFCLGSVWCEHKTEKRKHARVPSRLQSIVAVLFYLTHVHHLTYHKPSFCVCVFVCACLIGSHYNPVFFSVYGALVQQLKYQKPSFCLTLQRVKEKRHTKIQIEWKSSQMHVVFRFSSKIKRKTSYKREYIIANNIFCRLIDSFRYFYTFILISHSIIG